MPHLVARDTSAAGGLFEAVHGYLREGFCSCVVDLGRSRADAMPDWSRCSGALEVLVQACERLYQAEDGALATLRDPPDSSLANRHLLWAASKLREEIAAVRLADQVAVAQQLRELHRYLGLFLGELLVQMHAKEVEVDGLLRRDLSERTLQKLSADLEELADFLRSAPWTNRT
jgi:hypothetical protein